MDKNNLLVVAQYLDGVEKTEKEINFNNIEHKTVIGIRIYIDTSKIKKKTKRKCKKKNIIKTDNHIQSLDGLQKCTALKYFCATLNNIQSLDGIHNCTALQRLKLSNNNLTSLDGLQNCAMLEILEVSRNSLTSLDGLQNCTVLHKLDIDNNNLPSLNGLQNCTALVSLYATYNWLTSLDGLQNCTALESLCATYNSINSLDGLQNCIYLKWLFIYYNNLSSLDGLQNCSALQYLDISHNSGITYIPHFLIEFRDLCHIRTNGLEIELDARQRRWLNRMRNRNNIANNIQVYNNSQNVHDSSIQETVRTSIRRLLNQPHLSKLSDTSLDTLRDQIVVDSVLTPKSKDQLLSYISSNEELLELSLTYGELLWAVWQTIHNPDLDLDNDNGFSDETQREIKQILNQELDDSDCMCFTGRMTRLVNCLNGFSPLVEVRILDGVQIGNILVTIKESLEASEEGYSVEKHREMFRKEMLDRGERVGLIEEWLEHIE